jgi:hypothetical protein
LREWAESVFVGYAIDARQYGRCELVCFNVHPIVTFGTFGSSGSGR